MPFEVIITDLSELMEQKAQDRNADMQAILEGKASPEDIHRKNAFLQNTREWTEIDMRQIQNHFNDDEDDDLSGGKIVR
ncbi:hypothetical protein ACJU26_03235 [Acidithiobacillus sp. M4-SHS-6]|uniref:hypothetical protein n=1 Tax=Acidithiobacillus sp. M4-SHS-6 TaxID=3383024 RepID=UPI0039BDE30F